MRRYKLWENNEHTIRMLRGILRDSERLHKPNFEHPIHSLSPGDKYALRRAIRKLRDGK